MATEIVTEPPHDDIGLLTCQIRNLAISASNLVIELGPQDGETGDQILTMVNLIESLAEKIRAELRIGANYA